MAAAVVMLLTGVVVDLGTQGADVWAATPEQSPAAGKYYDRSGRYQGRVDAKGRSYDQSGRYQGRQDAKGRFYDRTGRYQGRQDAKGRFYDDSGRYQGRVDEKGRYYIKGRLSNMILGPSGENIYPEEIESVINNMDDVNESIVLERNGRLVALVQFNDNIINWNQEGEDQFFEKLQARKEAIMNYVNRHVNKSSKINDVEVVKGPFEKTATQKIRRFKYKKDENAAEGKPDESRDNSGQTTAGDGK